MTVADFFIGHVYLLDAFIFFSFWLVLFWTGASNRRQMLIVSFMTMSLGYFLEWMHLTDWWPPHFAFDTFLKIEDLLFGFSVGGMISGVYALVRPGIKREVVIYLGVPDRLLVAGASLLSVFGLFYIFHVHSFWSSMIALAIPTAVAGWLDLKSLPSLLLTGLIMTSVAFLGYLFTLHLDPDFVKETYLLEHLSGVLIYGIPIEELMWFLFSGVGIAAFQRIGVFGR
jgi:hypothetical protein